MVREPQTVRWGLRLLAIGYVFMLVAWPVWLVAQNTFADGTQSITQALSDPVVTHALRMTLMPCGTSGLPAGYPSATNERTMPETG